jgi:hypothetical protein
LLEPDKAVAPVFRCEVRVDAGTVFENPAMEVIRRAGVEGFGIAGEDIGPGGHGLSVCGVRERGKGEFDCSDYF